jgi:hypothetical protein
MKYMIKLLVILALLLTTFSATSTASAIGMFKFKGLGANASFSSLDGCIRTNVDVFTAEAIIQTIPSKREPFSSVNLFISQFNECENVQLLAAEGVKDLAEPDLQISSKLKWATLNTTVNVQDALTGHTFDVDVNLAWTESGPVIREHVNFHFGNQTCKSHSRGRAFVRLAETTGHVSDRTTNFTPQASLGANLISSNSAEMSIGCN